MKRLLIMLMLAVAPLAGLAACTGSNAVSQGDTNNFHFVSGNTIGTVIPAAQRHRAGDFTGTLLGGGSYRLSQQLGQVVVVNYWATWCGPCTAETPNFDQLYRQDKGQGVTFVGIDTKDVKSDAQAFVTSNQISFPIVFDEPGATALALGKIPANALPFTVLIDRQGRVAAVYLGAVQDKNLEPALATLTAETSPTAAGAPTSAGSGSAGH